MLEVGHFKRCPWCVIDGIARNKNWGPSPLAFPSLPPFILSLFSPYLFFPSFSLLPFFSYLSLPSLLLDIGLPKCSFRKPKSNLVHYRDFKIWGLEATILIIFLSISWPNLVHFKFVQMSCMEDRGAGPFLSTSLQVTVPSSHLVYQVKTAMNCKIWRLDKNR